MKFKENQYPSGDSVRSDLDYPCAPQISANPDVKATVAVVFVPHNADT